MKRTTIRLKRIIAGLLCGCALVTMASCKKSGEMSEAEIAAKREEKLVALQNVYKTNYIDVSMPGIGEDDYFSVNQVFEADDGLYIYGYYSKNSENNYEYGNVLLKSDIETGKSEILKKFVNEDSNTEYDPNATSSTSEYMSNLYVAPDHTIWYIIQKSFSDWSDPQNYVYTNSYTVYHTDLEENILSETSLDSCFEGEENPWISNVLYDSVNNNFIIGANEKMIVLKNDGSISETFDMTVSDSENIYKMDSLDDGTIIALSIVYDYNGGSAPVRKFKKLDVNTGKFEDYADLGDVDFYDFFPGVGNTVYYTGSSGVYLYDIDTQESKEILNFINSDLNSNRVNIMDSYQGDKFLIMEYTKNYEDTKFAILEKVSDDDIVEKYTMDFASVYLDDNLKDAIIDFNKQSTDCRINYIDYSQYNTDEDYEAGIKKLNQDIIKGNIPDLFNAAELPLDNYTSKSLIADLSVYMDKDEDFKREDYLENILTITSDEEGKVYSLIPSFYVQCLIGDKEYFNGKIKFTMDDLLNLCKKYPDASPFMYYLTRSDMLTGYYGEPIINAFTIANDGYGDFASDDFAKYLEFVKDFPEEFDWDEYYNNNPYGGDESNLFIDKQILLETAQLSDFDIQYMKRTHGENYAFAGYPVPGDDDGIYIRPACEIAVSAKSVMQQEAWDFMKYLLSDEYQESYYGFPVKKSVLDEKAKEVVERYEEMKKADEDRENSGEITPLPRVGVAVAETTDASADISIDAPALDIPAYNQRIYVTQEDVDKIYELINSVDAVVRSDDEINKIIEEESGAFFAGKKSVNDVANIIQSRVELYISENK